VRSHHERWDGTGYPDRLSGADIPLNARILAVADVFDALTTDRPYRPAFSRDDALRMLREDSGRSFDPAILAAFDRILPTLELAATPAIAARKGRLLSLVA
jgi:putative two-component system response regulator